MSIRPPKVSSIFVLLISLSISSGCSLKHEEPGSSLKIILEEQPSTTLFQTLLTPTILATPSAVSDFNCFGVNVTGPGIAGNLSELSDCTLNDNMNGRGVGIVSPRLVPRGQTIEMEVPTGLSRYIDVYGMYPPSRECDSAAAQSASKNVYFLGGVVKDLNESTAVTVPISFTSGVSASMTCTNSGSSYLATIDGSSNQGYKSTTCADGSIISATGPTPGTSAATAFSGAENTAVAAIDGSSAIHECTQSVSNDVQAQEFSFGISTETATAYYTKVTIKWVGSAGYYLGACAGGTITGATEVGSFPRLEIYNNSTTNWESIGTPGITSSTITAEFSPILDYINSGSVRVRVIGGQTVAECSRIETDYIEAHFQ